MTDKISKPMLDALARGAVPAEHPSADVLAAFVEHSLAAGEQRLVADHLTRCHDCREVVFLASDATEAGVADEQRVATMPRSRWTLRWVWVVPVAAMFLLIAGYFVRQRYVAVPAGSEIALQEAPEVASRPSAQMQQVTPPSAVVIVPSSAAKVQPQTAVAITPTAKKTKPAGAAVLAMDASPPTVAEKEVPQLKLAPQKSAAEASANAIGGPVAGTAPAVPIANGFASSPGETAQQFGAADSVTLSVNRGLAGIARIAHPGWRVTQQGHLEHVTPDGWVRVLGDQTSAFRVVGVIGSDVWAGGNDGMLFRSSDGGGQWHKVSIGTSGGVENAAIVSVRFDDSLHGVVVTDSGATYSTSDSGATWTKQ